VAATGPWGNDAIHVVLFHTNDLPGQSHALATPWVRPLPFAVGLIRLADQIDSERAAEPRAFVVDAGNWFRGTGALEQGPGYARRLANLGLDAACVGNHELGPGPAHLSRTLAETGLPAVVANVRDPATGTGLRGTMPWRMVERGGVRLAFVGLCAMVTPDITHADANDLTFEPPVVAWDRACREIGGQADLIVPLTYLPLAEARELARARPEIPLIITSQGHTRLERGVREGRTLIVENGAGGVSLGRVDLWLAMDSKKVSRSEARWIDLVEEPVAAACRELIAQTTE
jgi:2',3'-cyclic-nucleotide 2'-phosphodiesterase (5'-nucleotidase family)